MNPAATGRNGQDFEGKENIGRDGGSEIWPEVLYSNRGSHYTSASCASLNPVMTTQSNSELSSVGPLSETGEALSVAPRLFSETPLPAGGVLVLAEAMAHHAVRVLRLREGDALRLFDGTGGEFAACLTRIDKKSVEVRIEAHWAIERESVLPIRWVQCLQGGDKMDFSLQKAVELGVSEIVPVISQRSVVRLDGERALKRVAHWQQVVNAACEQCGRNRVPRVQALQSLERHLASSRKDDALRLFLSPFAEHTMASLGAPSSVELLVGPEGGLAPHEAVAARQAEFREIRLGPRVLRTETAGLAAIAAIHATWGDFR